MSGKRRAGVHYGWVVVALTFLTLVVGAGARSTPSVLIVPLEAEFGWSRATISFALSVGLLLYGALSPFGAAMLDSLGTRRTMVIALGGIAGAILLTPLMTAPWQLVLLWGVVVGSCTGLITSVLAATIVSRWFVARRGLVMGMLSSSAAAGQLIFLPLLAFMVTNLGWRAASLAIAGAALLVVPLLLLLMRDRPADMGLLPYGAVEAPAPPVRVANPLRHAFVVLDQAVRTRDFWLLSGTFFVCGASSNGLIGTHLIPACFDHGIAEVQAAGLLAGMGVFNIIGTTLSGWLSDRWSNRALLAWYYGLRGLSLMALPTALDASFVSLSLFALFYGLDWLATVPPTVRLTARSFGAERAGIVFGWIFAMHQVGAASVAWLAGLIRVELDGYLVAFMLSGGLCLVASVMSLMIGRRPSPAPPVPALA